MLKHRGLSYSELHKEIRWVSPAAAKVSSNVKLARSSNCIVIMSKNVLDLEDMC